MDDHTYVGFGFTFQFESKLSAERAATRLRIAGHPAEVRQGLYDGLPDPRTWWAHWDEARWDADGEVSESELEAEVEARLKAVSAFLVDYGYVAANWSLELSGGPGEAEEHEPPNDGRYTSFRDQSA